MNSKKQISSLILIAHIIALILYHLIGYTGHFGYDDLHYAKLASDLTLGISNFGDHYFYRITLVLFTAVSYLLFGINDFASSLPPMLITAFILTIVFFELKNEGSVRLTLALSLTLFSSWFIFYSDKLMPDIYLVLSIMTSLFVIRKFRYGIGKSPLKHSFLLVLSLFFGFLSKETIFFIVPLLIFFSATDLLKGRNIKFWLSSMAFGLSVIILYFIVIQVFTGDFFKRFTAIADNSYLNLCSYDKQPFKMVLARISYQFIGLLVFQGMMVSLLLILVILVQKKFNRLIKMEDPVTFWILSSFILLLTSNFMTVSFTSYSPMCLDPRHYLFLIPVAAIPASMVLSDFFMKRIHVMLILTSFSLVTVISYFLPGKSFQLHYLPVTLVLFYSAFAGKKWTNPAINTLLFIGSLMIMPADSIFYARKVNYREQKIIIKEQIINKTDSVVVVTDEVQKRLGNYFSGFNQNSHIKFSSFDEFTIDSIHDEKVILVLNAHTQYLSGINQETLPVYAKNMDSTAKKYFGDTALKISMYELNSEYLRKQKKDKLIYTFNDFENQYTYWDQNGNSLSDSVKHEGNRSTKMGEYSPLFSIFVDSLDLNAYTNIEIECEAYINFESQTKANLVVDISGSDLWRGLEINPFIKAYSNWWPVNYSLTYKSGDLKPGSQIRIYIWNIDKKPAFVDDFKITIFGNP